MGTEIDLHLPIMKAWIARQPAYLAHSRFPVGAPLLSELGNVLTDCNVESASFGLTICAERAAAAVGEAPIPPCSACREVLAKFHPSLSIRGAGPNGMYPDAIPEQ